MSSWSLSKSINVTTASIKRKIRVKLFFPITKELYKFLLVFLARNTVTETHRHTVIAMMYHGT